MGSNITIAKISKLASITNELFRRKGVKKVPVMGWFLNKSGFSNEEGVLFDHSSFGAYSLELREKTPGVTEYRGLGQKEWGEIDVPLNVLVEQFEYVYRENSRRAASGGAINPFGYAPDSSAFFVLQDPKAHPNFRKVILGDHLNGQFKLFKPFLMHQDKREYAPSVS